MAMLLRIICVASAVRASSLSISSKVMIDNDEFADLSARSCEDLKHASLKDLLRQAHFFCTGVERYWNGTMCGCAVGQIRTVTVDFLRKAADNVPQANLKVDPAVATTESADAGGTRVYLPQCRVDEHHRVPAIFYRSIRQSRAAGIKATLQALAGMKDETVQDDFWDNFKLCEKIEEKRQLSRGKPDGPVLFTFVREPVDHFLDVYADAARGGLFKVDGPDADAQVGSPRHFMHFLAMILTGGQIRGSPVLQAQMLQEQACSSRFDFIGKLEYASYDWPALASRAGCGDNIFENSSLPHRLMDNTSSALPTREAYEKLVQFIASSDGAVQKVLCWLLLPDYAVFDYAIPHACQTAEFEVMF